jgi:hypothetical protein
MTKISLPAVFINFAHSTLNELYALCQAKLLAADCIDKVNISVIIRFAQTI